MKRVEVLSPAGDMEVLKAAINAGADAIYLGGKEFGARAYAKNFDSEELIEALDYAHMFHKKIYLTLNTLIKEEEYDRVIPYLDPLYEHGLDGIIIQDIGLVKYLKDRYPKLERHISTQMTITGFRSSKLLKEYGVTRVVPARELSLEEIHKIKEELDIEIEAFVHGAMCYCYSGQCLFSSFLGGRSGNRGRCAQPCRLPYKVEGNHNTKELYALSLKDLSTAELVPQLIEAGIDSFKIEGRMKSAEYVAGVTSVYRKAVDDYYNGTFHGISKEDQYLLHHLYIRSGVENGYYKRHNGKEMITIDSPSYMGNDDALIAKIHDQYCTYEQKKKITGKVIMHVGEKACFVVNDKEASCMVYGDVIEPASKRPVTEEDVRKQFLKTGNTWYEFEDLSVEIVGEGFYPVKSMNELRRSGLNALTELLLKDYRNTPNLDRNTCDQKQFFADTDEKSGIFVAIQNKTQLYAAMESDITAVYIPTDLFISGEVSIAELEQLQKNKLTLIYAALPRIIRNRDEQYLKKVEELLKNDIFSGVLVKNLEEIQYLIDMSYQKEVITDHNLYIWNNESFQFMKPYFHVYTAPLELSRRELSMLNLHQAELIIYGHMPMMVTANCIKKTTDQCKHEYENRFSNSLQDRYGKVLPVCCNCLHCINIIYNAIPLSLHKEVSKYEQLGIHRMRLEFTNETKRQVRDILDYYTGKLMNFPVTEYTTGHSTKGAL